MADLHLYIEDEIGTTTTPKSIRKELEAVPKADTIYVHIDSPGGYVSDGDTIASYLKQRKENKIALIEGYCGSIATRIANACNKRKIIPTGTYMIHYAAGGAKGNKVQLEKVIDELNDIDKELIKDYSQITGLSESIIDGYMKEEKVMNAEEAVKLGFVDEIIEPLRAVAKFRVNDKMSNETDNLLKQIWDKVSKFANNSEEPKNEDEPSNMAIELEDGQMIFVRSEDGELEGKPVVMADAEGNPTEEPAPDGTHMLRDGRSITVENGVVASVQEAENREDEKEEMKAKIADQEAKIKDLEEQLSAKAESEQEAVKAQEEMTEQFQNLAKDIEQLKKVTVGASFKEDKPYTKPQDKSIDKEQVKQDYNGMDRLAQKVMQKIK